IRLELMFFFFFFSSRRRHTRWPRDWSSDVCSSDLAPCRFAGCEIILCEDATRTDKARLFVALSVDGLTAFRREIVERSVPTEKSWWGYDVIKIVDPDGNELLIPVAEQSKP